MLIHDYADDSIEAVDDSEGERFAVSAVDATRPEDEDSFYTFRRKIMRLFANSNGRSWQGFVRHHHVRSVIEDTTAFRNMLGAANYPGYCL